MIKIVTAFMLGTFTFVSSNTFEYGFGAGVGELFGEAGFSIQLQEGSWAAAVGKNITSHNYTLLLSNGEYLFGNAHLITASASLGLSFQRIESDKKKPRFCFGIYDTHDIGEVSGYKAYYGIQFIRYSLKEKEFGFPMPIIGFTYFFEIK